MKIIMAAGGSGGHIFPALSVAQELKKNNHDIIFVGAFGALQNKIEQDFPVIPISVKGFSLSPKRFFSSIFLMFKAIGESLRIIRESKPDVIAGFGSYSAFAVVAAGILKGCPTLIHEQNVLPGRANHLLSKCAAKIAITFKESEKYFPKAKTVLTGCPSHAKSSPLSKEELLTKYGLMPGLPVILVFGGSQGSRHVNEEFVKAAKILKEKMNFQVVHLSGEHDKAVLKKMYAELKITHFLSSFLDTMGEVYQISDLVIGRAGAVSVTEIGIFLRPAVLIPYPYAGGHQKENAKILEKTGLARILEEKNLSAELFAEMIYELLKNETIREDVKQNINKIVFADAAMRIAKEIENLK